MSARRNTKAIECAELAVNQCKAVRRARAESRLRKTGQTNKLEIQLYASGANGELIFAVPHFVREITAGKVRKLHDEWREWRSLYDACSKLKDPKCDYPAMHVPSVFSITAFPIDDPKQARAFII